MLTIDQAKNQIYRQLEERDIENAKRQISEEQKMQVLCGREQRAEVPDKNGHDVLR